MRSRKVKQFLHHAKLFFSRESFLVLRKVLIFILIIAWLFSGWPQVWPFGKFGTSKIRIPPEISKTEAAEIKNFENRKISFSYTDESEDENLIIKTDQKTYLGLTRAEVYFSVTNAGRKPEQVGFQFHFPENQGTISKIEKWTENVPYEIDVPDFGPMSYFCETGWQEIANKEAGELFDQYQCQATEEVKNCDSLSEDNKTCTLDKAQIGSHKETNYKNSWRETELSNNQLADRRNFLEKILGLGPDKKSIPQNFKVKKSTGQSYEISGGETQYFKAEIQFPINSSGEFYIEAIGDKSGYGLLDPWWDSNWLYKKPITITYSGSALTDYQIKIVTDTQSLINGGKMQSDCDDIRMIDSAEGSEDELNYWIESGTCGTASTRIWVKLPSITGNKTIYMYYGNDSAPNASNGSDTFVFFDDFETGIGFDEGSLNPTTTTTQYISPNQSIFGQGVANYRQQYRDPYSGRDRIFESWIRSYQPGGSGVTTCSLIGIGIAHPEGGGDSGAGTSLGYQVVIDERTGNLSIRKNYYSGDAVTGENIGLNFDNWYFLRFIWTSGGELKAEVFDANLTSLGTLETTDQAWSGDPYTDGEYGVVAYNNGYWDDYRVRKYAPTEPTTEVGSEIEFVDVTVYSFGSQTVNLDVPSTNQYIGGGFSIIENISARNVTGITITEHGTVNAQTNLANVKLYYDLDTTSPYDCAGESYGGSESQFGSTGNFNGADGTASFTGSVGISTTQTMCVYVVLDVGSGAGKNETLEVKINNPSTDVTVSSGSVSPSSAIEISGTTTLLTPPDLQQIHYRWRNDDAGELGVWWDSDWNYRKQLTISAGTGAGTDYQIKLNIGESSGSSGADFHLEGHIQSDFDDLRFVDDDDATELSYWIEEITGTSPNQTAAVWVKVQDDLDSDVNIFVYYGNDSAISASNGGNTFMFFDDFDDGDATGWTEHNGTWSVVDLGGNYRYYQSANTATYLRTSNGESTWTDYILETKIRIASGGSTGGFAGVLLRFQDENNHYAVILDDRPDDSIWIRKWVGGSYSGSEWTDVTFDRDTWYNLRAYVSGNTVGTYFEGITHEYTFTNFANGKIALVMHGTQAYYDDIRVRKYASSEPAFFSAASEETPEAGATWAANEDTELNDLAKGTIKRLRIEISNEGGQTASDVTYRLEVSEANPSTCSAGTYERVSTDADWEMVDSSYFTDGDPTVNASDGLTDENITFVPGELKDIGDQTGAITLTTTQFTEIEYSVQATASATGGATYCFRLTNAGSTTNFTYTEAKYGKVTIAGFSTAIEVRAQNYTTSVSTITFPAAAPETTVSQPYNDIDGSGSPQTFGGAGTAKPVVTLYNGGASTLTIWYNITTFTNSVVSSEYYLINAPGAACENAGLIDNPVTFDENTNTEITIVNGNNKDLYLKTILSSVAGKSGTSTLTILGETL